MYRGATCLVDNQLLKLDRGSDTSEQLELSYAGGIHH